jgi:hypothetical protein
MHEGAFPDHLEGGTFERIQQQHYGMKLLAYTLINVRAFWGA